MKTRAAITVDPKLHAGVKRLVKQRKTSVSSLFEQFVKSQREVSGSAVDEMIGAA